MYKMYSEILVTIFLDLFCPCLNLSLFNTKSYMQITDTHTKVLNYYICEI